MANKKTLHGKQTIEHHEPHKKLVFSCASEGKAVPSPHVAPVMLLLLKPQC